MWKQESNYSYFLKRFMRDQINKIDRAIHAGKFKSNSRIGNHFGVLFYENLFKNIHLFNADTQRTSLLQRNKCSFLLNI